MKQLILAVVAFLMVSNAAFAQVSKSDDRLEFRPNWALEAQGGAAYTVGEATLGELTSPAAQMSLIYNFHHAMGVRLSLSGWQGKGCMVAADEIYRFRFIQGNADYVLDLASLFDGFKHDRIWHPYAFVGFGVGLGFDNKEAGKFYGEYDHVLSQYWDMADFIIARAGLGMDFWVADNVALGLEVNSNGYADKFNSKGAIGKFEPDFQFNALLGLKVCIGKETRTSKAYAAKLEAEEAARLAEEALAKAEAERLAAEKAAEQERLAAEAARAEAERLAAQKAAEEAAAVEAVREQTRKEQTVHVFFTIGSSVIRTAEDAKLVKLAEFLKANEDYIVDLVGHSDKATGSAARNMYVSKMRSDSVKERLLELGVPADRIYATYVGDTVQPFAENDLNRVIVCTVK